MSDVWFLFSLDFVTNGIPKSFEQHEAYVHQAYVAFKKQHHQAYAAFKNLLIKVGDSENFSRVQTSNRILR